MFKNYRVFNSAFLIFFVFLIAFPGVVSSDKNYPKRPFKYSHIKTFINHGKDYSFIGSHYDLSFGTVQRDQNSLVLDYILFTTTVVPSDLDTMALHYCQKKYRRNALKNYENMFLHLKEDAYFSLYVGKEDPSNPIETRLVPGWDPRNDKNRDGQIDDTEHSNLANPNATARTKSEARVPIYYWGPPNRDYVMNVGNPKYQRYYTKQYLPSMFPNTDGFFLDTLEKRIPFNVSTLKILEYPDQSKWTKDMVSFLKKIVKSAKGRLIIGNGWDNIPFVIDGNEREEIFNIVKPFQHFFDSFHRISNLDALNKMQLIQYNPFSVYMRYHQEFSNLALTNERDYMFGLAAFYMIKGPNTYFGVGMHPYDDPEQHWFPAIEYDVGQPVAPFYVFYDGAQIPQEAKNVVLNGSFEIPDSEGPSSFGWNKFLYSSVVSEGCFDGSQCAYVSSSTFGSNTIEQQSVALEPYTDYTLACSVKTENVTGDIQGNYGAQVYVYDFDDASFMIKDLAFTFPFLTGTLPWTTYQATFRTGADTDGYIKFRLKYASGKAWFDKLAIVEGKYPDTKILARDYANALVLLKLGPIDMGLGDETLTTHALGDQFRLLNKDGTLGDITTTIQLRNREGAILIKSR